MAQPTISDGTTTITFHTFETMSVIFKTIKATIVQYPYGQEQEVFDVGMKEKLYTFAFILKNIDGGDTAYVQFESLETIWKTEHATNSYHRKITFNKPGSTTTKTIYGKIMAVTADIVAGEDEITINGSMDIAIDDVEATF